MPTNEGWLTTLEADLAKAERERDAFKKDAMVLRAQVTLLRRVVGDYYNACTCTGSEIEHTNRWARTCMDLVDK